ncbi:ATP-binding protein [Phenylobacterium sp.]|uniref:AAA family ATPase n=1 Tax=Phenylobacterium sp. TaxID=1871053 RepID=UPI0019C4E0C5|nr:ATP-binding protein [Phenylobacterium sp.]MBC7168711.1 ATP-binding protein [Phenylobacterium sp.]
MTVHDTTVKPAGAIAPLTNVSLFAELVERVMDRHRSLPAIGAFYGPSGFGKTFAATYGAHKRRAYYVEVGESWTKAKFCKALLTELGVPPRGTIGDMVEVIIRHLMETARPLIIDEADHIVKRGYVETLREIHDKSGAPILLIGEELLPHKLQVWERFHNRVLDWVPAQPCDLRDVGLLARVYAPGVAIAEDLAMLLLTKSEARARRVAVNLDRVREFAMLEGRDAVDAAAWGDRALFTGAAPARRVS